jgi:hypothetical protein
MVRRGLSTILELEVRLPGRKALGHASERATSSFPGRLLAVVRAANNVGPSFVSGWSALRVATALVGVSALNQRVKTDFGWPRVGSGPLFWRFGFRR